MKLCTELHVLEQHEDSLEKSNRSRKDDSLTGDVPDCPELCCGWQPRQGPGAFGLHGEATSSPGEQAISTLVLVLAVRGCLELMHGFVPGIGCHHLGQM